MTFGEAVCNALGMGGSAPVVPVSFGILGSGWLELTFAALFASLFILVFLYMVSQALRNQMLEAWTKFELFQIFGTTIIIGFSIIWIYGFCNFDMSFLDSARYPQGMKMEAIVDRYFKQIEELGYLIFYYMNFVVKIVNLIANSTWASNPLAVGSTSTPLQTFSQITGLMFLMLGGYVTSFLMLQLQMRIVEYMAIAGLFFLYPFGIFLRAFEPTRPLGGTLIGLTIALFFFYPLMIVFNDYIVWHRVEAAEQEITQQVGAANSKADPNNYQLPTPNDFQRNIKELDPSDPATLQTRNKLVENATSGVFILLQPVLVYMIAAVALPVINFIVLVELTRGITHFLGEEIDVTNLTRLI
ncbi:MAG: hypothetical protein N3G80_00700 [Candidatus Micrarchaeota archaeon]|nr:hypothetical protein [Candidatus Micrarchaeota archaeon]